MYNQSINTHKYLLILVIDMIRVIVVGKVKNDEYAALCAEYLKRCTRFEKVEVIEVKDCGKEKEAIRILDLISDEVVVPLTIPGPQMTTESFSNFLKDTTQKGVCLIIGGPEGLDPSVLAAASRTLSLSSLTLPHELARVMLLEQIYRALTILYRHPYHRA